MKTISILLIGLFLFIFEVSNAQSNRNRIFGLNWNEGEVRFTALDILTGNVSILSDSINGDYVRYGVSDIDPIRKRYMYIRREADEDLGIVSLNTLTGALINDVQIDLPEISGPNPYVLISHIGYNWLDGLLYGILLQREEVGEGLIYLVTINLNTGALNYISQNPIDEIPVIDTGNSDIDPINRRFIYVTPDRIYTIDLDSGDIINNPTINYPPASTLQYVANTTYDYQNEIIYCLHYIDIGNGQGELRLASIDPLTGNLDIISDNKISYDGFGNGDCDIDPTNNRFMYIRQDTLHVVRLSDGIEIIKRRVQNVNDAFIPFINLAYDDLSIIPPVVSMDMGEEILMNSGEIIELNVWLGDDVTYLWNDGNTDAIRNVTEPGIYSVTITKEGFAIEGSIAIEMSTSADYLATDFIFEIKPNPATEFLQYKIEETNNFEAKILVFDINGQLLQSTIVTDPQGKISVSDLPSGTYVLKYETAEGIRATQKLILQK